jgi:hypothetical protein
LPWPAGRPCPPGTGGSGKADVSAGGLDVGVAVAEGVDGSGADGRAIGLLNRGTWGGEGAR